MLPNSNQMRVTYDRMPKICRSNACGSNAFVNGCWNKILVVDTPSAITIKVNDCLLFKSDFAKTSNHSIDSLDLSEQFNFWIFFTDSDDADAQTIKKNAIF